jgi:hypothetical protein
MPRALPPALPHRLAAALICLALLPAPALAQGAAVDGYVEGIPDLPLMPGLTELQDGGLIFDKPGGRIVEAFAEGRIAPQSVIAFYDQTLPQLGWQRETPGSYLREGERLDLDLSQDAEGTTVHFRLYPQ